MMLQTACSPQVCHLFHLDEDNDGITWVPALGQKLLRRDLAAAFLSHPDLLILSGILTCQRCDGGQQAIILDFL